MSVIGSLTLRDMASKCNSWRRKRCRFLETQGRAGGWLAWSGESERRLRPPRKPSWEIPATNMLLRWPAGNEHNPFWAPKGWSAGPGEERFYSIHRAFALADTMRFASDVRWELDCLAALRAKFERVGERDELAGLAGLQERAKKWQKKDSPAQSGVSADGETEAPPARRQARRL